MLGLSRVTNCNHDIVMKNHENLARISKLTATEKEAVTLIAAKQLEATIKIRVFNRGVKSNDQIIGHYKHYKAYFGKDKFVQKTKFKPNPKTRKTMTFETGWQGLRALQGRQIERVDLAYSGALQLSIQTFRNNKNIVIAITSEDGKLKRETMEKRYGDIFIPSKKDMRIFEDSILAAIEQVISKKI